VGAIKGELPEGADDFEIIEELRELSGTQIPAAVAELKNAPVRHTAECEKTDMKETVRKAIEWVS